MRSATEDRGSLMRRMRAKWRWLAAVGVAGGAFAVGGQLAVSAQSGESSVPVAWCEVLTQAQAQAALGAPVTVTDSGTACSYTVVQDGRVSSLTVMAAPAGLTADTFADGLSQYARAANAAFTRADVGDEAYATLGSPASQLIARSGERFLAVVLIDQHRTDEARLAMLSELARASLVRYQ
jgi:hypothetical protein